MPPTHTDEGIRAALELRARWAPNCAKLTQRAVEKHVKNIFQKLRLAPADTDHRGVLAVLRNLEAR